MKRAAIPIPMSVSFMGAEAIGTSVLYYVCSISHDLRRKGGLCPHHLGQEGAGLCGDDYGEEDQLSQSLDEGTYIIKEI